MIVVQIRGYKGGKQSNIKYGKTSDVLMKQNYFI